MENEFQCCKCCHELNLQDRLPYVLPSCGHSICQECLVNYIQSELTLTCSVDKQELIVSSIQCLVPREQQYFPVNQSVIALLKKKRLLNKQHKYFSSSIDYVEEVNDVNGKQQNILSSRSCEQLPKHNICPLHFKDLELVCQQDGQCICVNCALFGEHKFHNYKPIDIYIKEMEQMVNDITVLYKEIQLESVAIETNKYIAQFEQNLTNKKISTLHSIDLKYEELFDELRLIQSEAKIIISKNFNNYFEEEKLKLEKEYTELKQDIDKWLKQASQQLNAFLENSECEQIIVFEANIFHAGKLIEQKISDKQKIIDINIQQIINQQDLIIPIETIKACFQKSDKPLLGNEFLNLDSDLLFPEPTLYQSLRVSEQPTQPASPQHEAIQCNYYSQTQTPKIIKKERSLTLMQTEPSFELPNSINSSRLKCYKSSKFSQNTRINQRITNCIEQLEQLEIVDFSQIDLSEQIIQSMRFPLKRQVVKVLKLTQCKITDDLFAKLFKFLEETGIVSLHLQNNLLSDKSLDLILNLVRQRAIKLRSVYMTGNSIQLMKSKKKIEELKKSCVQVVI